MADVSAAPRELPLLLGPLRGEPEMLLLLGVPDDGGVVHMRSWSADDWSAAPRSRAERATALLGWLESEVAGGRTMNQSLYSVRLWLRGEGGGSATR